MKSFSHEQNIMYIIVEYKHTHHLTYEEKNQENKREAPNWLPNR